MTRYIDADKLLDEVQTESGCIDFSMTATDIRKMIREQPTADVAEAVYCEDCKYYEAVNNDDHGWCKLIDDYPTEISKRYDDDYCSKGKRKES